MKLAILFLAPLILAAQQDQDRQIRQAGVCARCHVISVVEWGVSKHFKAGTDCVSCHGASQGHVIDERNNIKPEKVPHEAAIAGLCAGCHSGCPKSGQKAGCQSCHHVHALMNPKAPVNSKDERLDALEAQHARAADAARRGDELRRQGKLAEACAALGEAAALAPADRNIAARLTACRRRLQPGFPGFEVVGSGFDDATGLPRRVRVAGFGIDMVLIPGGKFEMGPDRQEVRVRPFYLAVHEVTQAEWQALAGNNPSAHQGTKFPDAVRMPVEQVSWRDCQSALEQMNRKVTGGGFRLPTEAEWEFAAHGDSAANAPFGKPAPGPVESGKPNRYGLFNMLGNVWEWCSSVSKDYPYQAADGRESPDAAGLRVLRGGSFADPPGWFDQKSRFAERTDRRLPVNGLRIARTIPE